MLRALNKHGIKRTEKEQIQCGNCDKTFTTRSGMIKHNVKYHGMKFSNSCNICHKTYKSIAHLKRHKSSEHGHECDKCEKMFQTEDELDSHFVASHVDAKQSSDLIKH